MKNSIPLFSAGAVVLAFAAAVVGCRTGSPASDNGVVAAAISPDGRNEIRLTVGDRLMYGVFRDGKALVPGSEISMSFDGGRTIGPGARLERAESCGYGVRAVFEGGWAVRLAARDDGVAYRFETSFPGRAKVLDERADVALSEPDAKAYVNYDRGGWREIGDCMQDSWESVTKVQTFGGIAARDNVVYLPVVFQMGDGTALCVTESDLRDYSGWLMRRDPSSPSNPLKAVFAMWPAETVDVDWKRGDKPAGRPLRQKRVTKRAGYIVETEGSRAYPWRVFQIAQRPIGLCESTIVYDLAEGAKGDFSWVKPGKVAWDWWNAFDNKGTKKGCTTEGYMRFIDFAAEHGVEYVIFDEGWSKNLDIWTYAPNVDVPRLIEYADGKGVGIILWMAVGQVYGKEAKVAEHFAKLGAKGFKVDFMDREDADMVAFEEKFAAECAKHRLVVDYHGMSKPTGIHRTYPNILNYEGVHGLEQMKWFKGEDFMLNDLMQFYVRMSAGPMDYTPGAMDNYPIGAYKGTYTDPGSIGTRCHQIALMSLYLAPLQMLSDSPTKYERNLECFRYMAAVPTVWDETVGIDGEPESFAVAARRHGTDWWCAGIASAAGKAYELDTSFLKGGEWSAEVFKDAPDAADKPTGYVRETLRVKAGDRIRVDMAPGGGFSIRFSPAAK